MKYRVGLTDRRPAKKSAVRSNRGRISGKGLLSFGKFKRISDIARKNSARPAKRKVTQRGGKTNSPLKKKLVKFAYIALCVGFFLTCASVVVGGIYLKSIESSLPDPNKLVDRSSDLSTQIFDRSGKLLYTIHGEQNREFVPLDQIPDHTKWALLAAEDIQFYEHKGLDLVGIAKAAYDSVILQIPARGASTISQQLVKNTILFDVLGAEAFERTITRKIKEILVTMQVEQNLSKDDILQFYMNEVPLGGVNYGYQAAANAYFGKDVQDLDIAESAMIAGLIQSPGIYSPLFGTNPELAKERQLYVLNQMLKHNDLTGVTEEEIEAAKVQEIKYSSKAIDIKAPHFVFYVRQLLVDQFGEDQVVRGGLRVTTTLDLSLQGIGEEEIKNGIKQHGARWGVSNGAMVAINPKNGDILVMVGSIDYNNAANPKIDGNVNVTISPRQMGSSVKPYTYLTAFKQGYGPWLETPDVKNLNFGAYKLLNWDERYFGVMTAREALIKSRNIPAVYTMQLIGVDNFIETAETLGITTLTQRDRYGLSLTLGAGEMKLLEHTSAYSVFASEGIKRDSRAILEVKDQKGNVLVAKSENKGKRVWDEKEIYALNWILCDLGGFGDQPLNHNYVVNGRRTYCGKTGTTDGPKDLTSMMYHKNLVIGVWAGNNNNVATPGAWSTTVPLPIASSFMTRVAGRYKPESFTRPAGITAVSICNDTGEIASKNSDCKKVASIYIAGKAPKSDSRESVTVCKSNNKIPTNLSQAKEFKMTVDKILLKKELENTLQQNNYESYLKSTKGSNYIFEKPESAECSLPLGPGNAPVVDITSPASGSSHAAGSTITISADARALESVTKVEFSFDGVVIGEDTSAPYSYSYTIPSGTVAGSHSISAKVYDNKGKNGTSTKFITITSPSDSVSISISSPTNGGIVSQLQPQ